MAGIIEEKPVELLSNKVLDNFLTPKSIERIHQERRSEYYDLISFGGGSCPRVVGKHAVSLGWKKICFLTNGSDNGGSTFDIVEALHPLYGPTLPVGDITSALIALLDSYKFELLNLRSWKLDPQRFSEVERKEFTKAIANITTFQGRLAVAIKLYQSKVSDSDVISETRSGFYSQLLELGKQVDETGLVRPGTKGLDLSEASVRHQIFNALMIRTGAYDTNRKKPDSERFMVGLWLLQRALNIQYAVFPCSIDEQVLYAEWINESGKVIWSTKHTLPNKPHGVTNREGQVALSNAPDNVKFLENGGYAHYGKFCFDQDRSKPIAYPEATLALTQLRPGSPIIYGPSSFIASISPCLALKEIVEKIVKRLDCPKILFLNLTLNNETIGMSVTDFLDFWELNTGRPLSETVNYVIVNNDTNSTPEITDSLLDKGDTVETFKFRGPLTLTDGERRSLPGRGITLVEAPLATVNRQLMRLSSTGEREYVWVPNHHSERLMVVAHSITADFNENKRKETSGKSKKVEEVPIKLTLNSGESFDATFFRSCK